MYISDDFSFHLNSLFWNRLSQSISLCRFLSLSAYFKLWFYSLQLLGQVNGASSGGVGVTPLFCWELGLRGEAAVRIWIKACGPHLPMVMIDLYVYMSHEATCLSSVSFKNSNKRCFLCFSQVVVYLWSQYFVLDFTCVYVFYCPSPWKLW